MNSRKNIEKNFLFLFLMDSLIFWNSYDFFSIFFTFFRNSFIKYLKRCCYDIFRIITPKLLEDHIECCYDDIIKIRVLMFVFKNFNASKF